MKRPGNNLSTFAHGKGTRTRQRGAADRVVFRPFATARGWTIAPGAIIGHEIKRSSGGENVAKAYPDIRMAAGTVLAVVACAMFVVSPKRKQGADQDRFSMVLTGPLAANGKQALLDEDQRQTNAKGGLLDARSFIY